MLVLVYYYCKKIYTRGLITYLPISLQNALLNRSLYDIMMDIWFIPKISEILALFVKPFLFKMEPKEAEDLIKTAQPALRSVLATKGLINLVPTRISKHLTGRTKGRKKQITRELKNGIKLYQRIAYRPPEIAETDFKWDNHAEFVSFTNSKLKRVRRFPEYSFGNLFRKQLNKSLKEKILSIGSKEVMLASGLSASAYMMIYKTSHDVKKASAAAALVFLLAFLTNRFLTKSGRSE